MGKVSGLTRGDKRRNERKRQLRRQVPHQNAILGIDLGENRQVAALTDHDTVVIGRKAVTGPVHQLGALLEWAVRQAAAQGFSSVTVVCEPTGHRWITLMELADRAGLPLVCVQPLAVHASREGDDYTRDKTDHRDAVLIARLAARLDCYLPQRPDPVYARLRQLGARRTGLIEEATAQQHQLRDLLGLGWPAVLGACAQPWESTTWQASLAVVLDRCAGDPARLRRLGAARFQAAVRRELARWGGQRPRLRIITAVFDALTDTRGAGPHRHGALERAHLVLDDWRSARLRLTEVEQRMTAIIDQLGLTPIITSIPGLSIVAGAAILAETCDLTGYATARSVVKHAGLNPAEKTSGTFTGRTRITHRGRPRLRLAAWRATWALIRHNPVTAARYHHLTTRDDNRLTPAQAHTACTAALLRWLHATITRNTTWNPDTAAPTTHHQAAA